MIQLPTRIPSFPFGALALAFCLWAAGSGPALLAATAADKNASDQEAEAEAEDETRLKRVELGLSPTTPPTEFRTISAADYVLGAYDQLEIQLLGLKPERWTPTVSPQGTISLDLVGTVPCAGLRIAELQAKLKKALARYYRDFELTVVVTRLRGIEVTVSGQVVSPGPCSVAGRTRVWEAIQRSGGITPAGSVRRVRIRGREGGERVVDLYPFLFEGREESNPILEAGDTVFVPVAERVIGMTGEVRRTGYYELMAGESFARLLTLAGGPTANAALSRVRIDRFRGDEPPHQIWVDAAAALRGDAGADPELADGDVIFLPHISTYTGNVSVRGEVRQPLTELLREGMTVRDLVRMAGGATANASLERAYLERVSPQGNGKELTWIDLRQALAGDSAQNLALRDGDVLVLPPAWNFYGKVSVTGELRALTTVAVAESRAAAGDRRLETRTGADGREGLSAQRQFDLVEGMRVSDLVRLAGGFTAMAARDRARLVRVRPDGVKEATTVNLSAVTAAPGSEVDLLLRDGDSLHVPSISLLQQTVVVSGEVVGTGIFEAGAGLAGGAVLKRRGLYELKEGDTVRDLLLSVGGVTANAALRAARLERRGEQGEVERIPVDLYRLLMEKDETANVALRNGDEFIVPALTDIIYVVGAVSQPGAYEYRESGSTLLSMVMRAGGFTGRAVRNNVHLVRRQGDKEPVITKVNLDAVIKQGKVDRDVTVRPGDLIFVPEKFVTMQDVLQTLGTVQMLRYYYDVFGND